jgi:hypothetical protein
VPIKQRKYKLHISEKRILEGTTDDDGLVEHPFIPPGDYKMELDGLDNFIVVPTLPLHLSRRITRVPGFHLETILPTLQIRLFDRSARPLPFAPCLVTLAGKDPRPDRASGPPAKPASASIPEADDKESAFITIRDLKLPTTVNVKWSRPADGDGSDSSLPKTTDQFEFELNVTIDIPDDTSEVASLSRLKNMGYVKGPDQEDPILAFQRDYKSRFTDIEIDGKLNPQTQEAIKEVHDKCDPVLKGQLS